ncbi:MAG: CBS domain-containing protein [Thauera sp.]
MMTTVKQILEQKGSAFHAVRPTDSVFDALSLMAQFDIGCVLVTENDKLVGIFTERDYARKVVLKGLVSRDVKVGDLMTHAPYTVGLSGTADDVMATMTAKRFRHIPVVENGKVLGIITIGDMVKSIVSQHEKTIKQLESYIAGDLAAE